MTEMLDIYDESLMKVGVKSRADVHRDGNWHKVFHCWVIYRDEEGKDWVIMQKRSPNKDTFPNCLDISAAGHYEAGETVHDAMRELEEELGLSPSFEDLIPLGTRISIAKYNTLIDCQIADVYFYICDQPLAEYRYQQEEISGLIAIPAKDGLRLFTSELDEITVPAVGYATDKITITRDDFIPVKDNYLPKVFLLATRCLNDEDHLWI